MLNIRDQYRDIIWEAIHTVPGRHNAQQELALLLSPPSWEEFYVTINRPRKQTAPGMSNVSYHDMKHWSAEIQEHCHQLLSRMWPEGHIPDSWKWRWLVGLLKSNDDTKLENLRPIGLIECLRKLYLASYTTASRRLGNNLITSIMLIMDLSLTKALIVHLFNYSTF